MPFAIPRAQRHPDFYCHGCGNKFAHRHGVGLYCSAACEGETKTRQAKEQEALKAAGFEQHADAPHTWIKDGVAVAIEQVLRKGHNVVLESHAEAVRNIAAMRNSQQAV